LISPVRRLLESPERLLGRYIRPGMTVVEPGCGMGYFSLPIARMLGPSGTLVCVDVQPRMIAGLQRRAARAGLGERIVTIACTEGDLGLARWQGRADVALAVHMLHEVPDPGQLLRELFAVLRPGGLLVILEPKGHVSADDFRRTLDAAHEAGFVASPQPAPRATLSAVLTRPEDQPR
jgi:ubiquinone/menaquinone biosynthesis C-methylase UbiE